MRNDTLHPDHVTVIDFGVKRSELNLKGAPPELITLLDRCERLEVGGFSNVNGYIGRKLIVNLAGRWSGDGDERGWFKPRSFGGRLGGLHIYSGNDLSDVVIKKLAESDGGE